MNNKISEGRKRIYVIGLILLLFVAVTVCVVYNDAFMYDTTIVKVLKTDNSFSREEEGPAQEIEKYYDQEITAAILNGAYKGGIIKLSNSYSDSGVNDERYYKGDQLMVSLNSNGNGGSILGKKRDVYVALFFVLFSILLIIVSRRHGVVVLVSFIINLLLLLIALSVYDRYGNILRVTMVVMILFSILTLLFAGGFHRKTAIAIFATLLTGALCWGIYVITRNTSERIPYEMMDYIVNPKDLSDLFLAGTLMGSLGAIMDVSISIAAGVSEVVTKTPNISLKALVNSIREMGYDIMGTMINVLFFTYLSGTIPILVIKIRNEYTLYHLVRFQLVFEIICFLIGAIGIVLAIPIAGFLSVVLYGYVPGHSPVEKKEGES